MIKPGTEWGRRVSRLVSDMLIRICSGCGGLVNSVNSFLLAYIPGSNGDTYAL